MQIYLTAIDVHALTEDKYDACCVSTALNHWTISKALHTVKESRYNELNALKGTKK